MADRMFSISAEWKEQEIHVAFCDDDEEQTCGVVLKREEALFLAKIMLEYAEQLALTEDEFWGDSEDEL